MAWFVANPYSHLCTYIGISTSCQIINTAHEIFTVALLQHMNVYLMNIHKLILYSFSEGHDRTQISLPGMQEQLLDTIKKGVPSTTPVVVVLMSGGPVDITWAKVIRIVLQS